MPGERVAMSWVLSNRNWAFEGVGWERGEHHGWGRVMLSEGASRQGMIEEQRLGWGRVQRQRRLRTVGSRLCSIRGTSYASQLGHGHALTSGEGDRSGAHLAS